MASKLISFTVLVLFVCLANAMKVNVHPARPSTLELRPENTQEADGKLPRRNIAVVATYQMQTEWLNAGLARLQELLDTNAKNGQLLQEMNKHFQAHAGYDWHLVLENITAGTIPPQYAYYRFDRNTTELFVAGYRHC